jgi:cytochrome b561
MLAGQALLLWLLFSGAACLCLLIWVALRELSLGIAKWSAVILFILATAISVLPVLFFRGTIQSGLGANLGLFLGLSLCLGAALRVLWSLRSRKEHMGNANLAIAACLNFWFALVVALSPLGG